MDVPGKVTRIHIADERDSKEMRWQGEWCRNDRHTECHQRVPEMDVGDRFLYAEVDPRVHLITNFVREDGNFCVAFMNEYFLTYAREDVNAEQQSPHPPTA
uniref:Uncharacterized protein n=1 Tax=Setaria digitata TaxID=48799 RepID=A0A915PJA5_9BILA